MLFSIKNLSCLCYIIQVKYKIIKTTQKTKTMTKEIIVLDKTN